MGLKTTTTTPPPTAAPPSTTTSSTTTGHSATYAPGVTSAADLEEQADAEEDAAQADLGARAHALVQFPAVVTADVVEMPSGRMRATALSIMPGVERTGLMVTKRGLGMVARAPPTPAPRPHVLRMEDIPEVAVKRPMLKREEPPEPHVPNTLRAEPEDNAAAGKREPMLQRSLEVTGSGEVKRMLRRRG